jgi:hypothetical protein
MYTRLLFVISISAASLVFAQGQPTDTYSSGVSNSAATVNGSPSESTASPAINGGATTPDTNMNGQPAVTGISGAYPSPTGSGIGSDSNDPNSTMHDDLNGSANVNGVPKGVNGPP